MRLSQADIARIVGVSPMTISRWLRALGRSEEPFGEIDAIRCLTLAELVRAGFVSPIAADLIREFDDEIRYLTLSSGRRCWIVFIETDRAFRLSAFSLQHLEALLDAFPLPVLTLPLHRAVETALAKLQHFTQSRAAA